MRCKVFLTITLCILAVSCSKLNPPKKDQMPKGHPPMQGSGATMGQPKVIAGVIAETMNGGEYTYIRLTTTTGDVWAAGPVTAVKVGDSAEVTGDMPMVDFKSTALNRSFEIIFFSPAIAKPGELSARTDSPHAMPGMGSNPHTSPLNQIQLDKPDFAGISKPNGGVTVAEIYADKSTLAGKKVTICGLVIKINPGIMGKNWIHIQDGTGAQGRHDLTVTTKDLPAVKDKVIAEGILTTDKDFGSGYKYEVIVENATVTVQK